MGEAGPSDVSHLDAPNFSFSGFQFSALLFAGYTSPSAFAQVFRRVVDVTPTQFRSTL
ncbi:MAG: AraC family transcriptional regulator [Bryobacteraceae bacterium]